MKFSLSEWMIKKLGNWLLVESPPTRAYLCDFKQIIEIIQPGDVLLIEGRSRASTIIKQVTQSPWSHAILCIGKLACITDPILEVSIKEALKQKIESESEFNSDTESGSKSVSELENQAEIINKSDFLIIETELGHGTIISSIEKYKEDHIRILRPRSLRKEEVYKIISYALTRLGKKYDVHHLFDLLRFFFPWDLYPRKWRVSLFKRNALKPTEDICSSMIADAFNSVGYPILPLIEKNNEKGLELILRDPWLYTPSDFDYSPYFDVIKYPILPLDLKPNFITDDGGKTITPIK